METNSIFSHQLKVEFELIILFSDNVRSVLLGLTNSLPNLVFCLYLQQQENMESLSNFCSPFPSSFPASTSVVLRMLQNSCLLVLFRVHLRTCCPWICLIPFLNLLTFAVFLHSLLTTFLTV